MAYPAEVGVNTFVVVKMPFGKRPEYRVRTVARTFAPEFAHHSEFLMPVVFRENVDESACSLAEILENSEAVFEVWLVIFSHLKTYKCMRYTSVRHQLNCLLPLLYVIARFKIQNLMCPNGIL